MIEFYVKEKDKPRRCLLCPLLNTFNECILQTKEANREAKTFADLLGGCPLLTVERELL